MIVKVNGYVIQGTPTECHDFLESENMNPAEQKPAEPKQLTWTELPAENRKPVARVKRVRQYGKRNHYPTSQLFIERTKRGWTQIQVCERVGCSASYYSRLELGMNPAHPEVAIQISKIFNSEILKLFNHDGSAIIHKGEESE